jgi:hypothetical protein
VTASDVSATKGQTISALSLVQASDADGDGLTYFFYDNSADPTSGHFTVNGVVQAAGTTFAVSAAQLAQTTFTAGSFNSDDLFVNVHDGAAFSGPQEFHVNVPANHTPTVTASDVSATKGQTISASSLFQASDADGDGLTYFFYDNSADPTSGHFTVNGVVQAAGTTFAVSAAQLAQTTFTAGSFNSDDLFVAVHDGMAFSGPQEFHVNIPANRAPTVTATDQTAPSGQVMSASSLFQASDADGDGLTYFFYDNSADPTSGHFTVNGVVQAAGTTFAVSAAQLAQTTFTVGTAGTEDLFVNVWDGLAFSGPQEFHVGVAPNHAPVITSNGGGATAAVNVAENTTAVTTVIASDADPLDSLAYSIAGGADAALFSINATTGVLSFVSAPNAESPQDAGGNNVYDVTVQVSDGAATDSQAIAVTVTDVNEFAPAITSNGGGATATANVAENSTAVTTVTASDADLSASLSYSLSGGADAALFSINSITGALSFLTAPNAESPQDAGGNNVYDVTVQVSDGTNTDSQAIAVTVTDVNEPPVITSNGGGVNATVTVAENSTAVTTVAATDPDVSPLLSYSITGGADAGLFSIDSTTGALSFLAAPNAESPQDAGGNNVYDVTVQVSDGTNTDSQAIAVTVTDVNEFPPVITSNAGGPTAAVNVAENTTAVTTVPPPISTYRLRFRTPSPAARTRRCSASTPQPAH